MYGRFNKQKNHLGLIDIFYKLSEKEKNVKLLLIGTGELEDIVKKKVEELKLNDKVLFLGAKPNVNEYYQAMDLFVLPSLFEGLPIVGIEAQTSGLKCIVSNNITKELDITNNVEFVPIEKEDEWISKIVQYKVNGYKRENMKEIIINKNYDINTEINKLENIYEG